jgi:hypothetical protein
MTNDPIISDCIRNLNNDLKELTREQRIELRRELILELEKEQEADEYPSVREPESACGVKIDLALAKWQHRIFM